MVASVYRNVVRRGPLCGRSGKGRSSITARYAVLIAAALLCTSPAIADRQDAIDACIDRLRETGTPDALNGGEVLGTKVADGGTLVTLRDAGGTVWECLGYDDGTAEQPKVVDAADDGEGAMDGAYGVDGARIHFPPGSSGTEVRGFVQGRDSFDHILAAKAGQTMNVSLEVVKTSGDGVIYFNILPPHSNGEALFVGSTAPDLTAQVKLPKSGDYTIRTYLMGNDRDTGQSVNYVIDVSVR